MPKLKAAGGHIVDIVGELEHDGVEYYAVHRPIKGSDPQDPFLIRKDNKFYTPYDLSGEKPQAGDIVSGPYGGSSTGYRVLGATDTQMLVIPKDDYKDGGWPVVASDEIQTEVYLPEGAIVYIRHLPDEYLKVQERP